MLGMGFHGGVDKWMRSRLRPSLQLRRHEVVFAMVKRAGIGQIQFFPSTPTPLKALAGAIEIELREEGFGLTDVTSRYRQRSR